MAFFVIPLDNDVPAYTFTVDMDGDSFQFEFRWNGRISQWVFDLFDGDQNAVQLGYPFYANFELLAQNVQTNRPDGAMIAIAEVGTIDATRFNIGVEVTLIYDEVSTE